jgi:hypothetical protein
MPIRKAWDALAYDHYKEYSFTKHMVGLHLSGHYQRTHESVIKLTRPQARVLDALTEAVGIPHQRGQAEIEIPEKARHYEEWLEKFYAEQDRGGS